MNPSIALLVSWTTAAVFLSAAVLQHQKLADQREEFKALAAEMERLSTERAVFDSEIEAFMTPLVLCWDAGGAVIKVAEGFACVRRGYRPARLIP